MAISAEYLVSAGSPSVVGGTSGVLQYFFSNPTQNLWNVTAVGVNPPVQSSQLGAVPSATSSIGMLPFDASGYKLQSLRFGLIASGVASVTTGTPTVTPIIQIVTPNVTTGSIYTSPVYTTFLMGTASSAMVANLPAAWSVAAQLYFEPLSGTLTGTQTWQITQKTGGGAAVTSTLASNFLTPVQGLVAGTPVNPNVPGQQTNEYGMNPGFGFVAGITFSAGSTGNTASLYEFKITQE